MRRRITKNGTGRSTNGRKEVAVSICKSGLSADGRQRYVLSIRFADGAYKKASGSGYVAVEIDDELGRMYFVESNRAEGFKLVKTNDKTSVQYFSFTIKNREEWEGACGEYDLLFDTNERIYYIEFDKNEADQ